MTCYDCKYRKEDEEGYGYCDKGGFWLPLWDLSRCCVGFEEAKE